MLVCHHSIIIIIIIIGIARHYLKCDPSTSKDGQLALRTVLHKVYYYRQHHPYTGAPVYICTTTTSNMPVGTWCADAYGIHPCYYNLAPPTPPALQAHGWVLSTTDCVTAHLVAAPLRPGSGRAS